MGLSRTEVNLRRLLAKCELMIKNNQKDDERFPKYIKSLEDFLKEIKQAGGINDNLNDYNKRIRNLKSQLGLNVDNDEDNKNSIIDPRQELFGLKQRSTAKGSNVDNLDELINYHESRQNKISEEMLYFTQNLKEQSQLANQLIKKDIEVVNRSTQLSEQNQAKLKVESEKLQEHSKRACKCWMWVMLVIVLIVFINMVLFMKVMKKK